MPRFQMAASLQPTAGEHVADASCDRAADWWQVTLSGWLDASTLPDVWKTVVGRGHGLKKFNDDSVGHRLQSNEHRVAVDY